MEKAQQGNANRLTVRRLLPVSRDEVFGAWLDEEGMREWMCPGSVLAAEARIDPRVGGSFRIVMKNANGETEHVGEYLVIDRPSKLVFTWISKYTENRPTLVTVELFDRGGQCELVLTHQDFPTSQWVADHERGWTSIVERLGQHLEGRKRARGAGV
jgi:uncharacterized protein YndB with AHSA1/START domain